MCEYVAQDAGSQVCRPVSASEDVALRAGEACALWMLKCFSLSVGLSRGEIWR